MASTPSRYLDLLPFVQPGPDQGNTGSCLYMGATGAMELIANKKYGIKNPRPYGRFDLSEPYLAKAPKPDIEGKTFWEQAVLAFNQGYGIHIKDWSYQPYEDGRASRDFWKSKDWEEMPRVPLPQVETIPLFVVGDKWSTDVLDDSHVQMIKDSLWKYKSPVLINYNDNNFWHTIVIVGYDDQLPGTCYYTPEDVCREDVGSFFVRDTFGVTVEVRDYDWFKKMGNAAFVIREVQ